MVGEVVDFEGILSSFVANSDTYEQYLWLSKVFSPF